MSDNNKTKEFLQKLAPCIERGELEKCVEEAAQVAGEMGIGAKELYDLSIEMWGIKKYNFVYVLALVAVEGVDRKDKAATYSNAGLAAQRIGGMEERAEECQKEAIKFNPNYAYAHYNYAILLRELNRKDEAEEHYKKAIEVDPDFSEAHNNYAQLLRELNRKDEVEEHYKKVIELNPNSAKGYFNYAILLNELNRKEESEKNYKKAIELNPDSATAHNNYALLLKELNRRIEAEEHFKKAIKFNPDFEVAHDNYANLLRELNRRVEAEEHYKKAIELNQNYEKVHNNYANFLGELNRKVEAEEHYKKAIELNPNYAVAHSNYANLLTGLKRFNEAEMHYLDAIKSNPNLAQVHGAYGLLLVELDKRDYAWKETEKAFEILKESERATFSNLTKAWFYETYADKNLERKKFRESSDDINKAGEEYLKASETVKGEIKYAFELKGNVCKAQSFIRKEHKTNQELVNDLKNASEFYKKASVCPAGGAEETCGACYSVMEVFSQALTVLEGVVYNKKPYISKEEWKVKLEKSNEVYLKKGSEKGTALVAALNELIKCVDELAYYTARKSSLQKKRLKECYKTLEDVSSKVEGGLRNITDPANEVLKNYAKEIGIPMPEEKALDESPSPFYKKLIKPIVVAIVTIILGYITNLLFEWKTHATIWNIIKSTIINQTFP